MPSPAPRPDARRNAYSPLSAALHWVTVPLVVGSFVLGYRMEDMPRSSALGMYRFHAALGLAILAVTALRLLLRLRPGGCPPPHPDLRGIHRTGVRASHAMLYVLLLAMVVTGLAMVLQTGAVHVLLAANATGAPTIEHDLLLRRAHHWISTALGALILAHLVGTLVHQLRFGGVFARMLANERGAPRVGP